MSRPKKPAAAAGKAVGRRASRPTSSLGDYLRRQRELANISLRKVADKSGIPAALLTEIETGLHHPSQSILQSLAGALRLSAETLYLQAGVIDPQDAEDADAIREIRRDPYLTDRQRDILIDVYLAFRNVNNPQTDTSS